MKRFCLLSAFLLSLAAGTSAFAEGLVNAVSFQPIPAGSAIFVRPLDNSDQNLVLLADFEKALKKKGYTISKDADLILTFETLDSAGSWTGGGTNPFIELSNNHDQSGVKAPRVHFNLFNSARGGLLNPDRQEKTRTVTPSRFRIDVTLDDKTNGKRLWQGWSSSDIAISVNPSATRTMIPVIIDGLGKNVKEKSFPLQ
ncbi:MAG: hypothetical protein HQ512_02070 [Rhodospirillales bacterium]|nr:hypothetical protein [Rhodospirillales bacterium]